jgi:molybdopterin/thiamine biosynthesis adenylyltransferase
MSRFSRNESLFGAGGQKLIGATTVAICGLGGLGSHLAQQLVYLGVRRFILIDFDVVTETSLNRLIGAVEEDVAAATLKIDVAARLILAVRPDAEIAKDPVRVADPVAEALLAEADIIFGCLDKDVHRLELMAIAAERQTPFFDLASDVVGEGEARYYGGRVVLCDGRGCLVCLPEILDREAIARERLEPAQAEVHRRIYGIDEDALEGTGPSVVSINGVVASLAVTEFAVMITGLRSPVVQLTYRADRGIVTRSADRGDSDCLYCHGFSRFERN